MTRPGAGDTVQCNRFRPIIKPDSSSNTWAVVSARIGESAGVAELTADSSESLPRPLLVASAFLVTAIGMVLWQTRVRFVISDDRPWDPGYPTCDVPPPEAGARPVCQRPTPGTVLYFAICLTAFAGLVWKMIAGG